ncbi:hypothetical protein ACJ41O_000855 [Fusarium nematophilum]
MSRSLARRRHRRRNRTPLSSQADTVVDADTDADADTYTYTYTETGGSVRHHSPLGPRLSERGSRINIMRQGFLKYAFSPDTAAASLEELDWMGVMTVQVEDLPRLMKDGFFWSMDNVLEAGGGFAGEKSNAPHDVVMDEQLAMEGVRKCYISPEATAQGWKHVRFYHLVDLPKENPRWIADLAIYARELRLLTNFALNSLNLSHVSGVQGHDLNGTMVYNYVASDPNRNLNALYNNEPLGGGWWPWPRAAALEEPDEPLGGTGGQGSEDDGQAQDK